jgi:hypothetical protein
MTDNKITIGHLPRKMRAVQVGISHARERRSPWWSVNGAVARAPPRPLVVAHAMEQTNSGATSVS